MFRKLFPPLVLILATAATPLHTADEPWYYYYDQALRLIERSDWQGAVENLEMALAEKDESSANARTYGMRFITYLPYYQLGVAYYAMGDMEQALRHFERERELGEAGKSDRYGPQLLAMIEASSDVSAPAEAVAEVEEHQRQETEARYQEGLRHFEAGEYQAAAAALVSVLSIDPEHAGASDLLARAKRAALQVELQAMAMSSPELVSSELATLVGVAQLDEPQPVAPPRGPEPEPEPEPVAAEPVQEPAAAVPEPVEAEPKVDEPAAAEPKVDEPAADPVGEPAPEEPVVEAEPVEPEPQAPVMEPEPERVEPEPDPEPEPPVAEPEPVEPEPEPQPEDPEPEQQQEQRPERENPDEGGGITGAVGGAVSAAAGGAAGAGGAAQAGGAVAGAAGGAAAGAAGGGSSESGDANMARMAETLASGIIQQGRALMEAGELEDAAVKFGSAVTILESAEAGGQMLDEAMGYVEAIEEELRREAEARRQQELAQLRAEVEQSTPPSIVLISPDLQIDEVSEPVVNVQGVVQDGRGVSDVEVEINGQVWGETELGLGGSRGIRVSRREGGQTLGTRVDFSKEVHLVEGDNRIVIRARNIGGVTREERLEVRHRPPERDIWAVVIGVSRYEHEDIPDLQYARTDAEAFRDYLVNDFDVPADHVFTLFDEQVTTRSMLAALGEEVVRRAEPEDMVIIYYAGHGAPEEVGGSGDGNDGAEKYLVPYDANPTSLFSTGFSMDNISRIFGRIRAGTILFVSDACFSGAAGEGRTFGSSYSGTVGNYMSRLGGTGRIILTASAPNQLSYERDDFGHGVFTYHLLEGLRGSADQDGDGVVTANEAYQYVQVQVPQSTNNRQTPMWSGNQGGRIQLGLPGRRD